LIRGVLVGGLIGIVVEGCGGASHTTPNRPVKPATTTLVTTTRSTRTAGPPAPTTAAAAPPTPAQIQLRDALSPQLGKAGPDSGAFVYDITAGRELFALRAEVNRPPASVEKLYTSVAVLTELGPAARLRTSLLGTGHLGPGGVWHGDLYLHGDGDPSFGDGAFNSVWEGGYGPTAQQLVAQLRRLRLTRVTGPLFGDGSLFDARRGGPNTGYAADIPDIGGQLAALTYDHGATTRRLSPGAFAARELALTMHGAHIRVNASPVTATTPPEARELASVSSPPMSVLLKLTDVPSDDFFAEMLTKQLGARFASGGTTAEGAQVISSVVGGFGVNPTIVDGSGLSRSDRSSPVEVVDLLRSVWGTPTGRVLRGSLPIVGVNGTARRIGMHTAAQGRCVAKTGTLDYVTNLAGYCNGRGGHVLAFALFLDGPSNGQSMILLSPMVAAIARY
jgi:D-alanyl-D-alanine carboxypeptidase/D-alanyl-D-alanine-endopeptidase (penicillin-binding protein 4)